MNFCKRSYQPILRYLYTEVIKRRGEISLHKHFNPRCIDCLHGTADSRGHGIEFGQFTVKFTLTTFSMISCY